MHVRERFDLETASWRLQEAEEGAEAALIATPEEQTEIYVRLVRSKLDSSNEPSKNMQLVLYTSQQQQPAQEEPETPVQQQQPASEEPKTPLEKRLFEFVSFLADSLQSAVAGGVAKNIVKVRQTHDPLRSR